MPPELSVRTTDCAAAKDGSSSDSAKIVFVRLTAGTVFSSVRDKLFQIGFKRSVEREKVNELLLESRIRFLPSFGAWVVTVALHLSVGAGTQACKPAC